MGIDLTCMTIARVVIHTIHKRAGKSLPSAPTYATTVFRLPPGPAATLQTRITQALGKSSHGVQIKFVKDDDDSFMQIAATLLHCNDSTFLTKSQELANNLAVAQSSKDLPPSKLFVATGTCGSANRNYLLAIKADMQDGFTETAGALNHLTELFLTPSQKLFKIGMIIEDVTSAPDEDELYDAANYSAVLFDHLLNALETREAAQYFYSGFLGAQLVVSDKSLTRQFFEGTKNFINAAPIDQPKKIELLEALRVDLRSNSAVIHVETFAKTYLPKEQREAYVAHMDSHGFTRDAVTKNLEYVNTRLKKKQKIRFQGEVEITAPADMLYKLVEIQSQTATETILKINAPIVIQE